MSFETARTLLFMRYDDPEANEINEAIVGLFRATLDNHATNALAWATTLNQALNRLTEGGDLLFEAQERISALTDEADEHRDDVKEAQEARDIAEKEVEEWREVAFAVLNDTLDADLRGGPSGLCVDDFRIFCEQSRDNLDEEVERLRAEVEKQTRLISELEDALSEADNRPSAPTGLLTLLTAPGAGPLPPPPPKALAPSAGVQNLPIPPDPEPEAEAAEPAATECIDLTGFSAADADVMERAPTDGMRVPEVRDWLRTAKIAFVRQAYMLDTRNSVQNLCAEVIALADYGNRPGWSIVSLNGRGKGEGTCRYAIEAEGDTDVLQDALSIEVECPVFQRKTIVKALEHRISEVGA